MYAVLLLVYMLMSMRLSISSPQKRTPRYVTVTLVSIIDNAWCALMCLRGVPGKHYGMLISQGGSIDIGESLEDAAKRELYEESGVKLEGVQFNNEPVVLKHLMTSGPLVNYYCIVPYDILVRGPSKRHAWEVIQDDSLKQLVPDAVLIHEENSTEFGTETANSYTGLAWIKLPKLLEMKDHLLPEGFKILQTLVEILPEISY